VLVWGAGRVTRRRARALSSHGVEIAAWVDIDPRKIGGALGGVPVLAPHELPPAGGGFVVSYVPAVGARESIEGALAHRGYRAGADYVMAA
jgi:hypothetical protein